MASVPAARSAPLIPTLARLYRPLERYAYTLIRMATGAIFLPHGVQKLFMGGATTVGAMGLGVVELAGGLLLIFGILVRPVAVLLAFDALLVIAANIGKGWLWTRGGVQYHSFLLGLCFAVLVAGPGRYAVGYWPKLAFDAAWKPLNDRLIPIGYAIARVWFALLILPSGYEKVFENGAARIAAGNILKTGFYPPLFWAWVVALLEFFGMILLALGLGTRLVAFLMAIELAVITVTIQLPNGYFWTSRGAEFALVLFVVCCAFVIGGGGRYTVDRRLRREL
jgi:putative oxidoreductase